MFLKLRNKKGFTITELVIVIAVIAILAAVLIPTFSQVIDNSKKSHDEQLVKSINKALSAYTAETQKTPSDYETLMLVLSEADLTDDANPFLLAEELKQENAYIIWYPHANSVMLVVDGQSDYMVTFTSSIGMGNGVYVYTSDDVAPALGYALCTNGEYNFVAKMYYDFYITSGGDITQFISNGNYTSEQIKNNISNSAWANSIIAAIGNQEQGYTHSAVIESEVMNQLQTSNSATINVSEIVTVDKESPSYNTVVEQTIRASLATLATLANNNETALKLDNKNVKFEGVEDVVVDMSEVQTTAIGIKYRKDTTLATATGESTFSTDFGGMTIANYKVEENQFVAAGSEWQTAEDNGLGYPAYCFTYGLFGTVYAKPGDTVTISNLNIKGVDMNLNGATETIGGKDVLAVSDNAGVLVGFAQGDVVLENITIDGSSVEGENGRFYGYDGVAAVVGRFYANPGGHHNTLTINNVDVSNIDVYGQRRASIYIGYASGKYANSSVDVKIEDSVATNCNVIVERSDGGGIYFGALGDIASTAVLNIDGVELNNITTTFKFRKDTQSEFISLENDPTNLIPSLSRINRYVYGKIGDKYLYIAMIEETSLVISGAGLKIVETGTTYYLHNDTYSINKDATEQQFSTIGPEAPAEEGTE